MLNCTTAAAKQICRKLAQHPGAVGLRISAQKTDRSGLAYRFEPCFALEDFDVVAYTGGGAVVLCRDTLPFVAGATLDFADRFSFAPQTLSAKCAGGVAAG